MKNPYTILNHSDTSMTIDHTSDFIPYRNGFTSMDPRLFDSPRNERLVLDRPPFHTRNTQPQENLYSDENKNFVGFYPSYDQIKGGSIVYYTDLDIAEPYTTPPYSLPCRIQPTLLIDPMGAYRPIYERTPLFEKNNAAFPYSFDQDQVQFREDIMSLNERKINESDFQMYQYFVNRSRFFPQTIS